MLSLNESSFPASQTSPLPKPRPCVAGHSAFLVVGVGSCMLLSLCSEA